MATKRKLSVLWNHFVEDETGKRAKCNYCLQYISISSGSVGNLGRHIKNKHPAIIVSVERQSIGETGGQNLENIASSSNLKPTQVTNSEIDKQVIKMISKGHHALRIVEEPEFKKLINMVSHCPGY